MALLPAGFIDGSAVTGEMLRRAVSVGARGETSIIRPGDLKVTQTNPPSAAVVVGPGSASISGRIFTPGREDQVYMVTNDQAMTVPVPANTGSTPVVRDIFAVVRDPQYAGGGGRNNEDDPMWGLHVQSAVPTRPYIWLGRITIPANTAAITQAMISEPGGLQNIYGIDSICRPFELARSVPDGEIFEVTTVTNMRNIQPNNPQPSDFRSWPLTADTLRPNVPTWATKLRLKITLTGVEYTGTDRGVANLRATFDTQESPLIQVSSNGYSRQNMVVWGKFNVPASLRGRNVAYIGVRAIQFRGAGNFQQDAATSILYEYDFYEEKL